MDRATISGRHATVGASHGFNVCYLAVAMALGFLLFGSIVQAAPLNLGLKPFPDLMSSFVTTSYTALGGAFSATGTALTLNDDGVGPALNITGGTFGITGTISSAGVASSALLNIG